VIRVRLRRKKALKLAVPRGPGKAYTPEEKTAMLAAAKKARSRAIYPALMLALNTGERDAEIRAGDPRGEFRREQSVVGPPPLPACELRTF
jgi:hypothetical protein